MSPLPPSPFLSVDGSPPSPTETLGAARTDELQTVGTTVSVRSEIDETGSTEAPESAGVLRIKKIFGCSYAEYLNLKPMGKTLKAFCTHRAHAKARGISFELGLWEWWTIWKSSGHWEERGRGENNYCMCRKGDVGPYAAGNVFIALFRENASNHPRKKYKLPMGVRRQYTKFSAQRRIGGKQFVVGTYQTAELAHAAYLAFEGPPQ